MPPWIAEVAAAKFEDEMGVAALQGLVIELAEAFRAESEMEVVGIAIHRERSNDLHIHVIFSESVETMLPKKVPARELQEIISALAEERIAHGSHNLSPSAGRNQVIKEVRNQVQSWIREGMEFVPGWTEKGLPKSDPFLNELKPVSGNRTIGENDGRLFYPRWKMVRKKKRRPFRFLGPSFRGKMALWEVSGRDEQIAAKGDRLAESANSFRSYTRRVISGEDLSATYLDLWVERKFARLITDLLNTEERARVDDLARTAVRRYQQHGSQNERTVEELIYERVESLKTHLVTEAESKAMSDLHQQNKLLEAGLSQSNHLNDALRRENLQLKADLAASRSKELSPALRSAIDSIPADLRESIEGDDDARIVHMLKVKAMAFKSAAEFYQKFVFDLVDKLVKLVNPSFKRLHLLVAQAAAELNIPLLRWNDPEIAQGDSPEKP